MTVGETTQEGKDRLQALVDSHTNGARRRSRRITYAGLVAIGVATTLVAGLLVDRLSVTFSNDEATAQVVKAIQAERARTTRIACEAQNRRHVRLEVALGAFVADRNPDAAEREEAREFITTLADAMAPRRDCDRLVRRSVIRERQNDGP